MLNAKSSNCPVIQFIRQAYIIRFYNFVSCRMALKSTNQRPRKCTSNFGYPTSGSFIHREKAGTGISIIHAITSRYGHKDDDATIKIHQQTMANLEHSMNAPFLKLIGFDDIRNKQSNYKYLEILNTRNQNVSSFGELGQLSSLCPNLVELDISKNLLHSWDQIFQAVSDLQHLQILNISDNKLCLWPENLQFKILHLKTLVCGSMDLAWHEIKMLAFVFPNIENLIAPNNKIQTCDCDETMFLQLKLLDVEGNLISDWSEIMKLKDLPLLNDINLNGLKISDIQISNSNCFKSLERLNLKHNVINDWGSIGQLNNLANLCSLGLIGNPICASDTPAMINQIIVAMIGKLHFLNGVDFREDRKGAEIDYLKKFGLEWIKIKSNEDAIREFLNSHCRYLDLINLHGEIELSELKVEAKTIKDSLIEVNLAYEDRIIRKKVPPTMQIQKLVTLCQRLFQLSCSPTLYHVSQEKPTFEFDLDEIREICLYSVQNGDKIVVKC